MPILRVATIADIPAMQALIASSAIDLSVSFYTPSQAQAMLQYVFGVDTQLLADQTYFLIEENEKMLACGGWSRRKTLFGGDQAKHGEDSLLDPATDAARIRAFFVAPFAARLGLGSMLLKHCTEQAQAAGFHTLELVATMPGIPLYRARGFIELEQFDLHLPDGIDAPVCRMQKKLMVA